MTAAAPEPNREGTQRNLMTAWVEDGTHGEGQAEIISELKCRCSGQIPQHIHLLVLNQKEILKTREYNNL